MVGSFRFDIVPVRARLKVVGRARFARQPAIASGASPLATTTTRTWEPAWHRRARSQRANARTLLHLGKAAEFLSTHHSAQRDMSKNSRAKQLGSVSGKPELAVLPGPRKPLWGCSCGCADNWACRLRCHRCDRPAPQSTADAARTAAATWLPQRSAAPRGRPQNSGGARAARQVQPEETFAQIVARRYGSGPGPSPGTPSATAGGDTPMEPVSTPGSPEEQRVTQLRYWKERRAAALRMGEMGAPDVQECEWRIKELEQAALAARPWATRVQAATDARKAAADKLESIRVDLTAARQAAQVLEAEETKAQTALTAAEQTLAAVQAEGAPSRGQPASGLAAVNITSAFDTLAAVATALPHGGGGNVAGGSVEELLAQLRALLEAAVAGGAAAVRVGDAVAARDDLAASVLAAERPQTAPPGASAVLSASASSGVPVTAVSTGDDAPDAAEVESGAAALSLAAAAAAVPNASPATGPQQTLEQAFKGKGKGKDRDAPYG